MDLPDDAGSDRWEDLSDEEFVAWLRRSLPDRSWTLGEFAELERRGFEVLDADPELRDAIREEYEKLSASMRDALAPVQERMQKLSDAFGKGLAEKIMPRFDLPPASFGVAFPPVEPLRLEPWAPDYDELASGIAERANADIDRAERGLELQQGMLEVLHDVRTETAALNHRDWIDWLGIGAAVVAAIAALVAAVVGVILIVD